MRPPYSDTATPAIPARGFLARDINVLNVVTVAVVGGNNVVVGVEVVALLGLIAGLLDAVTGSFLLWHRRSRDQEVYATSFELRFRREYQNLTNNSLRARFAEDVIRVGLKDLTGGDRTCNFLYVAVQMDYADQVQGSAWKNTSQTTP